jgi:hypothetical protein
MRKSMKYISKFLKIYFKESIFLKHRNNTYDDFTYNDFT